MGPGWSNEVGKAMARFALFALLATAIVGALIGFGVFKAFGQPRDGVARDSDLPIRSVEVEARAYMERVRIATGEKLPYDAARLEQALERLPGITIIDNRSGVTITAYRTGRINQEGERCWMVGDSELWMTDYERLPMEVYRVAETAICGLQRNWKRE